MLQRSRVMCRILCRRRRISAPRELGMQARAFEHEEAAGRVAGLPRERISIASELQGAEAAA